MLARHGDVHSGTVLAKPGKPLTFAAIPQDRRQRAQAATAQAEAAAKKVRGGPWPGGRPHSPREPRRLTQSHVPFGRGLLAAAQKRATAPVSTASVASAGGKAKAGTGVAAAARKEVFGADLGYGDGGAEVEKLQRALVSARCLPGKRSVTGFFGKETKEALQKWQRRNSISSTGYFGPRSRAGMNRQMRFSNLGFQTAEAAQAVAQAAASPAAGRYGGLAALALGAAAAAAALAGRFDVRGLPAALGALPSRLPLPAVANVPRPNLAKLAGPAWAAATATTTAAAGAARRARQSVARRLEARAEGLDAATLQVEDEAVGDRAWDPADAPEGEDRWSKADYEKRMALRRSNANLRGRLQQTEAQLRSALWQLRREKERADRAEALFLEMKSESEALKDELRKAGMAGRR